MNEIKIDNNRTTNTSSSTHLLSKYQKPLDDCELQIKQLQPVVSPRVDLSFYPAGFWVILAMAGNWQFLQMVKIWASIFSRKNKNQAIYAVSFRLHALFCLRTLCLDFRVYHESLLCLKTTLVGSGLRIRNFVPEDAEIMGACRNGHTAYVWRLFQERRASVNDVTPTNRSPLRVRAYQSFSSRERPF